MTTNSELMNKFGNQIANLKGWEIVPLEDVLKLITYGLTVRPKYHAQGIPLVSAAQIRNGIVDLSSAPRISINDYEKLSDKCKARTGDILFAKTGTIGHCAVCNSDEKIALAQNVARLVFDEKRIKATFALRYLRTPFIQDLAKRSAKGNAVQDLQLGELKKFPIPIPPLEEQRRIAAILDRADGVRRKRQEAIRLTEELLRSLFLDMFGDPITNPKGWEVIPLGKVLDILYRYPTFYGCQYVETGIPVLKIGSIDKDYIFDKNLSSYDKVTAEFSAQFPKTIVKKNDLVMAVRGDTTGKIGLVPSELVGANISPNLIRLSPYRNICLPQYLFWVFRCGQELIKGRINNTAKKSLTSTTLQKVPIPIPPIHSQEEFEKIFELVMSTTGKQQVLREKDDYFFNSLLQRAFRGEL